MSQTGSDTGFNVTSYRWMPMAWRPEPLTSRTQERVAAMDRSNLKRLRMLLEHETREAVPHEIAVLEALNIEVLRCVKPTPTSRSVVLGSDSVEWIADNAAPMPQPGDTGRVELFLNPDLPYETEFFAEVRSVRQTVSGSRVAAALLGCSPHVLESYQQLVFIYHRAERRAETLADSARP